MDVLEALTAHFLKADLLALPCRQDSGIVQPAARQGRSRRGGTGCLFLSHRWSPEMIFRSVVVSLRELLGPRWRP